MCFDYRMVIDKRVHRQLGWRGVYADVFEIGGKAYKLFLSRPEVPPRQTREGRKRIFHSQVDAYERIEKCDAWLAAHTPEFYGTCSIQDVIGDSGEIVNENYLLDCCYAMGVLDLGERDTDTGLYRNEAKLAGLFSFSAGYAPHLKHLEEAETRFKSLQINTSDASVCFPNDPARFKVFDFDSADKPHRKDRRIEPVEGTNFGAKGE